MIRCNNDFRGSRRPVWLRYAVPAVGVAIVAALTALTAMNRECKQRARHDGGSTPDTAVPPAAAIPPAVSQPRPIPTFPAAIAFDLSGNSGAAEANFRTVQLCQYDGPAASQPACAEPFAAAQHGPMPWAPWRPIPWQVFAQGEYIGPARTQHVPNYRVRVDDVLDFVYRLTRELSPTPYKLNVGDTIRVESLTDEKIDRDLVIQPDGSITLRLLGQVRAADRTVEELRQLLEEQYKQYYKVPAITVTPVRVDTRVQDLIASINNQFSAGVQSRRVRVTPEGTVQLPAVGSVPAQGLTLEELKFEIDERYGQIVNGIEVMPILFERAPRFLYVVGEVRTPGRFVLEGPTTVMQAIALAGGWNVGGNLHEVVIFRRAEDWRLIATKVDIRAALLGRTPTPAGEIWLRDSDVVVVPKTQLLLTDHFIELVFSRGIYGALPIGGSYNINSGSRL